MFPSTITALYQLASVQARDDDRIIWPGTALEARAYNKITLSRGNQKYRLVMMNMMQVRVKILVGISNVGRRGLDCVMI